MAVSELMAASPPNTSTYSHEVFISHRGEEMKLGFASHLYRALDDRGITSFLDKDELREGDDAREAVREAARSAIVRVPIFTKTFGSSEWCLDELVTMMDCWRKQQGKVIPVFYDVKPQELRKEEGPFALEFETYAKNCEGGGERRGRWKDALKEASCIVGLERQTYGGNEGALIEALVAKIVNEIAESLRVSTVPKPVGLDVKVQDAVDLFRLHRDTSVWVILIWGASGVGKTTLARAIYHRLGKDFKEASFVENGGVKKAIRMQNRLRKDLLHDKSDLRDDIATGRALLELGLRKKRVLIVLDGMSNDFSCVENLINLPRLCPGSLILLTSTDKTVFPHANVLNNVFRGARYELNTMEYEQSWQLFCSHAFGRPDADPPFPKLAMEVVKACNGLPLSLEVLGRHLSSMEVEEQWREAIVKLRDNKYKDISGRLKISY